MMEAVALHGTGLGIARLCAALGVARATYYRHRKAKVTITRRWTPFTGPIWGSGSLRLRQHRTGVIVHGDARGAGGSAPSRSRGPCGGALRMTAVRPSFSG